MTCDKCCAVLKRVHVFLREKVFAMSYFNTLVKAYKIAYPHKTHAFAQSEVKVYYDQIKNQPNVDTLVSNKVAEWKLVGNKKRSEQGIYNNFSF